MQIVKTSEADTGLGQERNNIDHEIGVYQVGDSGQFKVDIHVTSLDIMFKVILVSVLVSYAFAADLVQVLQDGGQTTLISLVQKAGLASALLSGQHTIFAPTNAAFAKLPQSTLDALSKDTSALSKILQYHVVDGSIPSSAATNELQLTTLSGQQIRFNIYKHNHAVTIQGSKITEFDKKTDNGYIHVIDTVMIPPEGSIVDLVVGDSELSTLLAQVKSANLVQALQGNNLTVFAPTNAAFSRLGSNVINHLTHNPSLLKDILLYHVVPHTEYSAGLFNREHLGTLDAHHDSIRIHHIGSHFYANNGRVIKADIGATNGVVHILLVCMLVSFAFGANLVDVLQQNGLHTLISMVQKAGLSNTLLSDKIGLANLLKYHVVQGSIPKSAVSNELQLTTLNGAQVRFNTYKFHVVTIQGMKITHSDRKTDNGYVHVISGVMLPPEGSIVDIVAASADFTTLLEKVKEANLVSALQGNNLTVFAPTNDAFRYLSSTTRNKLANDPNYLREVAAIYTLKMR
ncbi:hypothetical protein KUTeg_003949 [Tegillarca granosa]|uniref:FAS1 domain-containing protein n=1 Tax=Tegillarca granosa TaxID=220873 RepID=A0ABQ9FNK2_TEGGR|nr:hypothetical protein KUTeg_003949 [Tegillarca granosa]